MFDMLYQLALNHLIQEISMAILLVPGGYLGLCLRCFLLADTKYIGLLLL